MLLRHLVEAEGWTYVEDPFPGQRPDALGTRQTEVLNWAQACAGNVLAVKPGAGPDAVYSASHEIAEARTGFVHDERLLAEQIQILTHWCRDALQAAGELQALPIEALLP